MAALLNLDTLRGAGIAVGKAAGLVHVDTKSETMVLFASVADAAKLATFIAKQLPGGVSDETSGAARLLTPKAHKEVGIVLRGGVAFVIVAPAKSARDRVAVLLANIKAENSLAQSPEFQRTAGTLTFGQDLAIYASLPALFAADPSGMTRLVDREKGLKVDLIKNAKNPLKLMLIRRELRMLAASKIEYARNRKRAELLAGLGTIAASARVEASAVRAVMALAPSASSPFAKLLAPQPETVQLMRAMNAFPLLAVAGHMKVKPLLSVIEKLTDAQGVPFAQIKAIFGQLTKQSFDKDFVPMLSGEIGFAVTEGSKGRSGVDILLGVRSADKARNMLKRLAADKRMANFVVKSSSGPLFRIPSDGQSVFLTVAGTAIVATTDFALVERLQGAGATMARAVSHPGLKKLVDSSVRHAVVLVSGKLLGQMLAPKRHSRVKLRRWRERIPNIPRSEDYMRALTEMVKLDRTIAKAESDVEADEQRYYRRLGAGFGDALFIAQPGSRGLVAYGGLFLTSDLAKAIAAARVPAQRDETHKKKIKQRADLLTKRDKLWRQISDLRKRDIARFMNKK